MNDLIKKLEKKMRDFRGMDTHQTYWYRCGMYDAIQIIKKEKIYTSDDMANSLNEYTGDR